MIASFFVLLDALMTLHFLCKCVQGATDLVKPFCKLNGKCLSVTEQTAINTGYMAHIIIMCDPALVFLWLKRVYMLMLMFQDLHNELILHEQFYSITERSAQNGFIHDGVIKWKHFPHYWPFVRGSTGRRWIPLTKATDVELWCFLWSVPQQSLSKQSRC